MNHDSELPLHPDDHDLLDFEEDQLGEIESQLRRMRPVSADVDLTAIVRGAREVPAEAPTAVVATAARPSSLRATRRTRFYSALGIAWASGAVAGALLMLIAINWSRPGRLENETARRANVSKIETAPIPQLANASPPRPRDDTVAVRSDEMSPLRWQPGSLVSAVLADPRRDYPKAILSAGVHLPGLARSSAYDPETITAVASTTRNNFSSGSSRLGAESEFEPAPGITRGELLRRLQEDSFQWPL